MINVKIQYKKNRGILSTFQQTAFCQTIEDLRKIFITKLPVPSIDQTDLKRNDIWSLPLPEATYSDNIKERQKELDAQIAYYKNIFLNEGQLKKFQKWSSNADPFSKLSLAEAIHKAAYFLANSFEMPHTLIPAIEIAIIFNKIQDDDISTSIKKSNLDEYKAAEVARLLLWYLKYKLQPEFTNKFIIKKDEYIEIRDKKTGELIKLITLRGAQLIVQRYEEHIRKLDMLLFPSQNGLH